MLLVVSVVKKERK